MRLLQIGNTIINLENVTSINLYEAPVYGKAAPRVVFYFDGGFDEDGGQPQYVSFADEDAELIRAFFMGNATYTTIDTLNLTVLKSAQPVEAAGDSESDINERMRQESAVENELNF